MGDGIPKGPLGIDPLQFSITLFCLLILFVLYLLLPRAVRKQYFGAYPKRHVWSARSKHRGVSNSSFGGPQVFTLHRQFDLAAHAFDSIVYCRRRQPVCGAWIRQLCFCANAKRSSDSTTLFSANTGHAAE